MYPAGCPQLSCRLVSQSAKIRVRFQNFFGRHMGVVVLLGAGASFGSEPIHGASVPPLGVNLIQALMNLGGVAARLPVPLLGHFQSHGFEAGMNLMLEGYSGEVMPFQREMGRFLCNFAPSQHSLYRDLVLGLRHLEPTYCTLNYDMMLEEAAIESGLSLSWLGKRPGFVHVVKPHGSVNFWPDASLKLVNVRFENCSGYDFVAPMEIVTRREAVVRRFDESDSVSPIMAAYAMDKPFRVASEDISRIQKNWILAVREASQIFISGVRVVPHDTHIWGQLARCDAKIFYFGLGADESDFRSWIGKTGRVNAVFCKGGFDVAVPIICRAAI